MRYTMYIHGDLLYNTATQTTRWKVISPALELSDNEAGTCSFTVAPDNSFYDELSERTTIIDIYKNGKFIWAGRCADYSVDFYNQKSLNFEGIFAAFNDTHQESVKYENITLRAFVQNLLNIHNAKMQAQGVASGCPTFSIGTFTVDDGLKDRYCEYETTMESLANIIEDNGGHMYITKNTSTSNAYILNYIQDYRETTGQYIKFGKNLLDYSFNLNREEFATVILPLGKEDDEGNPLTIASVNQGSIYLVNPDGLARYGWIEKKYEDSSIETASVLKSNAQKILEKSVYEEASYEVTAIDLANLDNNINEINLYDTVRVISPFHNLDANFPVSALSFDLANPANDSFTLGATVTNTSLSAKSSSISLDFDKAMKNLPSESDILNKAKAQATSLITSATTGHITIKQGQNGADELIISEYEDYLTPASQKIWRWNLNGFGYSSTGYNGTFGLAMTMDGAIVADFITVGTMSANRVRTGTLTSQNNNTSWNLDTGEFSMLKGSINLGSGNFVVTDAGLVTIKSGSIRLGTESTTDFYAGTSSLYISEVGTICTRGMIRMLSDASTLGSFCIGKTFDQRQDPAANGIEILPTGQIDFYKTVNSEPVNSARIDSLTPSVATSGGKYGIEIRAINGDGNGWGAITLTCDNLTMSSQVEGSWYYYTGGTGTVNVGGTTLKFINGIMVTALS